MCTVVCLHWLEKRKQPAPSKTVGQVDVTRQNGWAEVQNIQACQNHTSHIHVQHKWAPFHFKLTGSHYKAADQGFKLNSHTASFSAGSLSLSLQLRPEGPVEKSAAGGPDKTLWQPQEWSQWYQGAQVVCHHWLDRHLPEEGNGPRVIKDNVMQCGVNRKRDLRSEFGKWENGFNEMLARRKIPSSLRVILTVCASSAQMILCCKPTK